MAGFLPLHMRQRRGDPVQRAFEVHVDRPVPLVDPEALEQRLRHQPGVVDHHVTAQGAPVALGARRQDRIQALARELTAGGGKAIAVTTDVTDRTQVQRLVDAAVEAFGRIASSRAAASPNPLLAPVMTMTLP
jgi:hypothetical protein